VGRVYANFTSHLRVNTLRARKEFKARDKKTAGFSGCLMAREEEENSGKFFVAGGTPCGASTDWSMVRLARLRLSVVKGGDVAQGFLLFQTDYGLAKPHLQAPLLVIGESRITHTSSPS
jgi:hypothetical protein